MKLPAHTVCRCPVAATGAAIASLPRIGLSRASKTQEERAQRRSAALRIFVRLAMVLFIAVAWAAPGRVAATEVTGIGSGMSALWYDAARSGEGYVLEVLPGDFALFDWYTYDESGNPRWLQAIGTVEHGESGDSIRFADLYALHGGRFGPGFDPDDVQRDRVGDATMTFGDCNHGNFRWHAYGESLTVPIERLTRTMALGCDEPNGVPGEPVQDYAGGSGSWYDVSHSGEGFSLHFVADGGTVLTWYTYDSEGHPYWMIGTGTVTDGQIVFSSLDAPHGARFGTAFHPSDVVHRDWGSLTMELGCTTGTAHYESSLPGFGSGDFNLIRLTQPLGLGCPYVKPKLTDLYDITWNEIPIPEGTPAEPDNYQADTVADDGTIAARHVLLDGPDYLSLWQPGSQQWHDISTPIIGPVYIAGDASNVVASDPVAPPGVVMHTMIWNRQAGWEPIPGEIYDQSVHYGVSKSFARIVGVGKLNGEFGNHPWIWSANEGQIPLPVTDEIPGATPLAVSDDGSVVVGVTVRFPDDFPIKVAVRWINGSDPEILHDPDGEELSVANQCDASCDIIYGAGLYDFDPAHSHPGEAWYLTSDGFFEYFGALPDASISSQSYGVGGVSSDGSIAVGTYGTYLNPDDQSSRPTGRTFIWTEKTGIVSVRSVVADLGIGDDDWGTMQGLSVSPDGRRVLLSGYHVEHPFQLRRWRAVILRLDPEPKAGQSHG
jgi:hypothetical protein